VSRQVFAEVPAVRSLSLSPAGVAYMTGYPFSGIKGTFSKNTRAFAGRDADADGVAEDVWPVIAHPS
jgi:hypothetical protein